MKRLIGLAVWLMLAAPAHAQFELLGSLVAAGATSASGGEFALEATVGQAALGSASGGSFTEWRGFWYLVQPPAGPGAGTAQIRLTALQNDGHAGGTLGVAVEVKTRGLANRTLGSALIDIDYDGEDLAYSGHSAGPISGAGTTVEAAALFGDPESGSGSGAFVRLSVTTSGIGTGNSGYDVGEEYVLFGRLDFTITEAGAGSSDLFVRPGSLSIGFYDSPQNTSQSGLIVPVMIDEIIDLYQTPLPIELLGFEGLMDGEAAVFRWTVGSTEEVSVFEIERKLEGGGFGTAAIVEAAPAPDGRFVHRIEGIEPGRHVFRLRLTARNGRTVYSAEIEIMAELAEAYRLGTLYPNPFNPQARFTLAVQQEQHVRIDLFDLLGRSVAVLHEGKLTAHEAHGFTFDAGHLPSGTYVIRIRGVHFSAVQTAVLLR